MAHFAMPVMGRDQAVLFATTLDDAVSSDHEVRIFDEFLCLQDWSDWEGEYCQNRGQPPIHPRVIAGVILYGLMRRIRSSRVLEYLTGHNIDFMWLTEARTIDHTTLCKFRKRFKKQLKGMFEKIGRLAMAVGLIRLGEITFDGSRVKANNDRYETWTVSDVEERLAKLVEEFGTALEDADKTDAADDERLGVLSNEVLPKNLADAKNRYELLKKAHQQLLEAEAARRRKDSKHAAQHPAQLPSTDPDSTVLPNKEGGQAPNYTPLTAVDAHRDFIVFADVIAGTNENAHLLQMVDQVTQSFGERPAAALADSLNATGPNIAGMETRGVEFLSPPPRERPTSNPAQREDPSQPVPPETWPSLPKNPQTKKLDKACFLYDEEADIYYCPMGKTLEYETTKPEIRQGQRVPLRIYRCHDCQDCPLLANCLTAENKNGRTVRRDIYTKQREQHAAKMQTAEASECYKLRFHAGETPFGWLKHVLGLRQFLLRGLENVRIEWLWACTAYNLKKYIAAMAGLRAKVAQWQTAVQS
jgi:transposase